MGRKRDLIENELSITIELHTENISCRKIADRVKISRNAVCNVIRYQRKDTQSKATNRVGTLSERACRSIVRKGGEG